MQEAMDQECPTACEEDSVQTELSFTLMAEQELLQSLILIFTTFIEEHGLCLLLPHFKNLLLSIEGVDTSISSLLL